MSKTGAMEIRKELKKMGISSRQVSVRSRYSSAIDVNVKALIPLSKIESVAEKHDVVHWDALGMEILSGGNTFVTVEYSWDWKDEQIKEWLELLAAEIQKEQPYWFHAGLDVPSKYRLMAEQMSKRSSVKWSQKDFSEILYHYRIMN